MWYKFGTNLCMVRMVSLLIFKASSINLSDAQLFSSTKDDTFWMTSGVRDENGLPVCSSSSRLSLPSKKRLCHRKTLALVKQDSPQTCCINFNVSEYFYRFWRWINNFSLFHCKNLTWKYYSLTSNTSILAFTWPIALKFCKKVTKRLRLIWYARVTACIFLRRTTG